MIVHIFTAYRYHLVPIISKGFATIFCHDAEHFFLLVGNNRLNRQLYVNQFTKIGFDNYAFCQSYWQLVKYLLKYRKSTVLFHAGSYLWHFTSLFVGCRNVNWICWGGNTSVRSYMGAKLKSFLFKHYNSIVTLMEPERLELITFWKINPQKVHTLSYCSKNDHEIDMLYKQLTSQGTVNYDKPVVLLGNSHHWLSNYISFLPRLSNYKGKIKVQCMLNYPFERGELYDTLIKLGKSVFGNDFKTNEDFYSDKRDYINYMNSCDIYICDVQQQTGLGAIRTCLRLGKKVYITGNNLDWIRQEYNSIVFSTDTIDEKLSYEDFVKPLSIEEKKHNYQNEVNSIERDRTKWHSYLQEIDR